MAQQVSDPERLLTEVQAAGVFKGSMIISKFETLEALMRLMTRRKAVLGALCCGLNSRSSLAQPSAFRLTIARKHSDARCSSGYLAVNGKIIAYTLELPWKGNALVLSSIPIGTYGGLLRYDNPDKWRIELTGVPGRTNVQIHTGNAPDDSEGCILVGDTLGSDLCSVRNSKKAYESLRTAFYGSANPVATPNKAITVTVEA